MIELIFVLVIVTGSSMIVMRGTVRAPFDPYKVEVRPTTKR